MDRYTERVIDRLKELEAENERLRNGLFAIENYILNSEESAEWNINQCRLLAAMAREGRAMSVSKFFRTGTEEEKERVFRDVMDAAERDQQLVLLQAENKRLRAALRKHGRHFDKCASRYVINGVWQRCDCGLDAALAKREVE